jgi:hypothetical protein
MIRHALVTVAAAAGLLLTGRQVRIPGVIASPTVPVSSVAELTVMANLLLDGAF